MSVDVSVDVSVGVYVCECGCEWAVFLNVTDFPLRLVTVRPSGWVILWSSGRTSSATM